MWAHAHTSSEERGKVIHVHIRGIRHREEAYVLVEIRVDEFKNCLQPGWGQATTLRRHMQRRCRVAVDKSASVYRRFGTVQSVIVVALPIHVPGSPKSSSLMEARSRPPARGLYLSRNRIISL